MMRPCIIRHPGCEGMTRGSTGAAGLTWPMVCQNCKDIEDSVLSASLKSQAQLMDNLLEALDPTPLTTEVPQ